jgi:hypothetical protein
VRRPALLGSARRAALKAAGTVGNLRARGRQERPVNAPSREALQAPEVSGPAAVGVPEPPGLAVATAEQEGSGEERDGPEHAPKPKQPARSGPPEPVHVPYARTGGEPDVVAAPPGRGGPRRPARSPFWAAVQSHLWLVAIVLVLVGAAGTAYWALRVHQRIGAATLEHDIASREHATTVRCIEQQPNGAVWACGLVYQAESVCLIANVNPVADWNTKPGTDLCSNRAELTALQPATITPSAVAMDLRTQFSVEVAKCAKIPARKVRWACLGPAPSSTSCVEFRVVPWTPWVIQRSPACSHIPALRKFLRKGR